MKATALPTSSSCSIFPNDKTTGSVAVDYRSGFMPHGVCFLGENPRVALQCPEPRSAGDRLLKRLSGPGSKLRRPTAWLPLRPALLESGGQSVVGRTPDGSKVHSLNGAKYSRWYSQATSILSADAPVTGISAASAGNGNPASRYVLPRRRPKSGGNPYVGMPREQCSDLIRQLTRRITELSQAEIDFVEGDDPHLVSRIGSSGVGSQRGSADRAARNGRRLHQKRRSLKSPRALWFEMTPTRNTPAPLRAVAHGPAPMDRDQVQARDRADRRYRRRGMRHRQHRSPT